MNTTRHRLVWGTLASLYFLLTTWAHLVFSIWLVSPRQFTWQGQTIGYSFRDALPWLLPLVALAMLVWLVGEARHHGTRRRGLVVATYWCLWGACVAAVDRWLTYSVPEYFHYPQYALLAWLLAKTLDPHRHHWPVATLLVLTTLLGAIDELAQYLWITASYSHYYDFNDVLVNLLAAVMGVMLFYGFRTPPQHRITRHRTAALMATAALCALLAGAGASDWVRLTPTQAVPAGGLSQAADGHTRLYLQRQAGLYDRWHPGAWRPRHWVLGPASGALGLVLIWLAWIPFGRVRATGAGKGSHTSHGYDPARHHVNTPPRTP